MSLLTTEDHRVHLSQERIASMKSETLSFTFAQKWWLYKRKQVSETVKHYYSNLSLRLGKRDSIPTVDSKFHAIRSEL